jgi:hypothetical protein
MSAGPKACGVDPVFDASQSIPKKLGFVWWDPMNTGLV